MAAVLLKLQTVDEHSLQLGDVVSGLYRDAEPARWAWKPATWGVSRFILGLAKVVIVGIPTASHGTLKMLVHVQVVVLWWKAAVVLGLVQSVMEVEAVFRPGAVTGAVGRAVGH